MKKAIAATALVLVAGGAFAGGAIAGNQHGQADYTLTETNIVNAPSGIAFRQCPERAEYWLGVNLKVVGYDQGVVTLRCLDR